MAFQATMSILTSCASLDVSAVRLHGPVTQPNHVTSREYVDLACAVVRDGILDEGVSGALDTLKENEFFLQDGTGP